MVGKVIAVSIIIAIIFIIIFNPNLMDELREKTEGIDYLSPSDVREHPEKYMGKNITVRGYYSTISFGVGEERGFILDKIPSSEAESQKILVTALYAEFAHNITVYDGAKYDFKGKLTNKKTMTGAPIFFVYEVKPV